MDDSWATDFDRMAERPSIPLSWSSRGTVMSSSTSLEEFPSAMVWISTCGGANSGKTSTFVCGRSTIPSAMTATAANTTSHRNLRLIQTMRRMRAPPPALSAFR